MGNFRVTGVGRVPACPAASCPSAEALSFQSQEDPPILSATRLLEAKARGPCCWFQHPSTKARSPEQATRSVRDCKDRERETGLSLKIASGLLRIELQRRRPWRSEGWEAGPPASRVGRPPWGRLAGWLSHSLAPFLPLVGGWSARMVPGSRCLFPTQPSARHTLPCGSVVLTARLSWT